MCSQVDVSGAYESLPHSKLMEVVGEALSPFMDEPCSIRRYGRIWADGHEGLKRAFVRQVRHAADRMRMCLPRYARHLTGSPCPQADFLDGDTGSSNMKGFVMSLQKKGMVHHSILVEQVRGMHELISHVDASSNVTLAALFFLRFSISARTSVAKRPLSSSAKC